MSKIRVLIIEDSALTRSVLERIINGDSEIEVVGTAIDPIIASKKIQHLNPDVITLDLIMPRMDGLTFLKKLMKSRPTPVIIISGNSPKASNNAIRALELGALEIIEKPDISTPERLKDVSEIITFAIKAAYSSLDKPSSAEFNAQKNVAELPASGISTGGKRAGIKSGFYVIGSSTGGPQVLNSILKNISPFCQGIVIAQHMPPVFTESFANRLDAECEVRVVEAKDGEIIEQGKVIILPGDFHGIIKGNIKGYYIKLEKTEKVNRHRPSVDVLFNSAALISKGTATGILLTGMGDDGAKGLLNLFNSGSVTIAQQGDTCAVFGMPRKAIELGAVKSILAPLDIASWINNNI